MSRAETRRQERDAKATKAAMGGSMKLDGSEVVLAIVTDAVAPNERGERPYRYWVRGPATQHTNAEMLQCLALMATTIVFGNAQHTGCSLQEAIDGAKEIFGKSLEAHCHRQVAMGIATQNLQTIEMDRGKPAQPK